METTTTARIAPPRRAEEDPPEPDARVRTQGRPPRLQDIARALDARPFTPHRLFRGGHAQTLRGALRWPRRLRMLREYAAAEERLFEVEEGVRLLAHCRWQPRRRSTRRSSSSPTRGSSSSVYMLARPQGYRAGFNVVRLNVRNCGGTEG